MYKKPLYHYCTLETLMTITKNRTVRLSDITKTNDGLEMLWVKRAYADIVEKVLWQKYHEAMRVGTTDINDWAIRRTVDMIKEYGEREQTKTWALCLSEDGDSLNQWRGYANNGEGVSIGFKLDYISKLGSSCISDDIRNYSKIAPVEYNKETLEREIYQLLSGINRMDFNTADQHIIDNLGIIERMAPFYKNPSFEKENEWRVTFSTNNQIFNGFNFSIPLKRNDDFLSYFTPLEYGFYVRNGRIVSYIDFKMVTPKDAIEKVIIGPTAKVSEYDIRLLLMKYEFLHDRYDKHITITHSKSSYRI